MNRKTIVLATHNNDKLLEIQSIVKKIKLDYNFSILKNWTLVEPIEDGNTFEENAFKKAQFAYNATGIASLSEDSGLCIKALDNAPGVYSKNWAIDNNYDVAFKKINKLMQHSSDSNAYFVSTFCFYENKNNFLFFSNELHGTISFPPSGENGFGYDSIFIPNGYNVTLGQMSMEEKNSISHRKKALLLFIDYIQNIK